MEVVFCMQQMDLQYNFDYKYTEECDLQLDNMHLYHIDQDMDLYSEDFYIALLQGNQH